MNTAFKLSRRGGSGTARRLLSAVMGAVAIAGGGMLAASPAQADSTESHCTDYNSWQLCLSYDYTTGTYAVNALNDYSTSETEALWLKIDGTMVQNEAFVIPSHAWRGFGYKAGFGQYEECAGIDNVQIICEDFSK